MWGLGRVIRCEIILTLQCQWWCWSRPSWWSWWSWRSRRWWSSPRSGTEAVCSSPGGGRGQSSCGELAGRTRRLQEGEEAASCRDRAGQEEAGKEEVVEEVGEASCHTDIPHSQVQYSQSVLHTDNSSVPAPVLLFPSEPRAWISPGAKQET